MSSITFSVFAEPSTPENTLSKNCLKYYYDTYKPMPEAKVFIYARDTTGKDSCLSYRADKETSLIIKEAKESCKKSHSSSECKVASINDNWMIKVNDFSQITQPDLKKLTDAEIQKLMGEAEDIIKGNCLPFFKTYLSLSNHKAFAYALDEQARVSCSQASSHTDVNYLKQSVLKSCEDYKKKQGTKAANSACKVFSINNEIVTQTDDFKQALDVINNKPIDLFQLAKTGAPKELEKALTSGIDVNIRDKFGYTPLLRAITKNRFDNVKFLVLNGADIHLKENLGFDALNTAIYSRSNNFELIKFLFEKGADINTKTKRSGNTPLHHASELGRIDVLKWLMAQGVDVNLMNNYTETPLHKAADQGHVNILKLLLHKGAKINEQTRRGITPLDNAIFRKRNKAIEFLKSKGAIENNPSHS